MTITLYNEKEEKIFVHDCSLGLSVDKAKEVARKALAGIYAENGMKCYAVLKTKQHGTHRINMNFKESV